MVATAHRAACSLSIDLSANEIPATGGHWRFAHATAVKGDKRSAVSFGNGDRRAELTLFVFLNQVMLILQYQMAQNLFYSEMLI